MRGDTEPNLQGQTQENAEAISPEKQEELKLMNHFAARGNLPAKGQSAFLQKRLQNQRKFFDSGDYYKDKAKPKLPPPGVPKAVGALGRITAPVAAPPPINLPPQFESPEAASMDRPDIESASSPTQLHHQSSTGAGGGSLSPTATPTATMTSPTGLEIPRPETVPQRKSSIIYPSAHSKLSPQPHLHHAPETLGLEGLDEQPST